MQNVSHPASKMNNVVYLDGNLKVLIHVEIGAQPPQFILRDLYTVLQFDDVIEFIDGEAAMVVVESAT